MITPLRVKTNSRTEFIDITQMIEKVISESGIRAGLCSLFVPHTTAAVTINENSDRNVLHDILKELNKIIPFDDKYVHFEGNSAAHIKSSIIGASTILMVEDGKLVLGTWQAVFFCEFDGPRDRSILVKIIQN